MDTKYQWSKMSPDRSEQVVVRSDDVDEWFRLIENAKGVLPTEAFPNDVGKPQATPVAQAQTPNPVCGVHHVPMSWKTGVSKKTGRPYAFWSCGEMNNGMYCDYKVK